MNVNDLDIKTIVTLLTIVFTAGGGWFMIKNLRAEVDRFRKHIAELLSFKQAAEVRLDHLERDKGGNSN